MGGNVLAYFFCRAKKDNSYIDVFWGLTFITPIYALLILYAAQGYQIYGRVILTAVLVSIWGFRLAYHIGSRHTKEDPRYVDMRERWTKEGSYEIQAFTWIFMMQGLFSLITNSASLYTVIFTSNNVMGWTSWAGLGVWLFGFIFELVGDT